MKRAIFVLKPGAVAVMFVLFCSVAARTALSERLAAQEPPPDTQQQGPPPDQQPPSDQAPPDQADVPNVQNQAPYANLSKEQLERLVAPIALYPDSLVAQILAATTYPSQIVDADNWVKAHQGLSPQELGQQANDQPWDDSVKALVPFPDVLANLASNLGWASELGDAYYNQPKDVMKAVQEMRKKAKKAGNLKSNEQEKVEDHDNDIQIEPAQPNVVYVPAYDPWVVYGYPIAPWPYWVNVPGIWWGGPGLYFGVGFPIAPFFGFGWGWHSWGLNWHSHELYFHGAPFVARGPDFFDRRGYYGGDRGFRPGVGFGDRGFHGSPGGNGFHGSPYRGFQPSHGGGGGVRSGPFTGINPGGASRGFSARGQQSMGGFHGGGFHGGGFHGGGGGHR